MSNWSADHELELACKVQSMDDIRQALEEDANVDCKGGAPLAHAINSNHEELFELLIEHGANVNTDGGSPLFVAIMAGNRKMVERLMAHGADTGIFLPKSKLKKLKTDEQILEALMEGAPPPPEDSDEGPPGGGD